MIQDIVEGGHSMLFCHLVDAEGQIAADLFLLQKWWPESKQSEDACFYYDQS